MLQIYINKENYEYDVRSLVKSFFQEQEMKIHFLETSQLEGKMERLKNGIKNDKADMLQELDASEQQETMILKITAEQFTLQYHAADTECRVYEKELVETRHATLSDYKNAFRLQLYGMLSDLTGKTLPWGNMIGIRPTKFPMAMLETGMTEEKIYCELKEKFAISDEKALLSIEIAKRERELLSGIHYKGGYSLYIGIPFCPTTCLYCSFTSYPIALWKKRIQEYLDAVEKEMTFISDIYKDKILDTVYIGGGTPTTLSAEELDILLTKLKAYFAFSTVKEFTVEAGRADSITREKLEVLLKHKVTRISINPQTMCEETLRFIGRQATAQQTRETYLLAREMGFENINMDIILGLPGEGVREVQRTIDEIVELAPDSLTVHSLAIKRASRLNRWIEENGLSAMKNTDEMMRISAEGAKRLSLHPYYLYRQKNMSGNFENVGYASEGKYGLYNILIMEEVQTIVALGAGTVTKRVFPNGRIERTDTVKDVGMYIEKIDEMIERKRNLLTME